MPPTRSAVAILDDGSELDPASPRMITQVLAVPSGNIEGLSEKLSRFHNGLDEVLAFLRAEKRAAPGKLAETRRIHPRACTPWQAADDDRLKAC